MQKVLNMISGWSPQCVSGTVFFSTAYFGVWWFTQFKPTYNANITLPGVDTRAGRDQFVRMGEAITKVVPPTTKIPGSEDANDAEEDERNAIAVVEGALELFSINEGTSKEACWVDRTYP